MPVIFCRTHCETIRNRISMGDPLDIGRLHKAFFRDNDHINPPIYLNSFFLSRLPSPQGRKITSPDARVVRLRGERVEGAPRLKAYSETESVWFSSPTGCATR